VVFGILEGAAGGCNLYFLLAFFLLFSERFFDFFARERKTRLASERSGEACAGL